MHTRASAHRTVVEVVVIQAHHGGLGGHEGVGLPAAVAEAAAEGSRLLGQATARQWATGWNSEPQKRLPCCRTRGHAAKKL